MDQALNLKDILHKYMALKPDFLIVPGMNNILG